VLGLVGRILSLMDSNLQPEIHNKATKEIRYQCLSSAKTRKVLGWKPLFTLDDGLRVTIDWYRQFFGNGTQPGEAL
jgi:CDP-glucose 4,6-dehydratase